MLLEKIYAETMANGGFSINILNNEEPKEGFMVSLPNKELKVSIERFNPQILRNYINSTNELNNPKMYLGTWIENNNVYVDTSENIINKEEAIRKGIERGQLAIYDVENQEVINLPTPQKSGTMQQQKTYLEMKIRELL